MLIRISGRHDGVKQYLEEGQKVGREMSRDELDERVVLTGDLDLTDAIIQSIDVAANVDRYLSITLSFKEDHVEVETLRQIVDDFKRFAMHAYRAEEYNLYAEAHLPKIKSYVDQRTGELVERKPHIHIVIPKRNLVSGHSLRPFGFDKQNLHFIDAFQEHTNARYGLASPKDNRRTFLTDASEMISRYRGDLFRANSRDLKEQILNAVLDRRIEGMDEFMALLREHGAVRIRNEGRDDAYPNVKPADAEKGVNLKEYVFSPAFIELPTEEKLVALASDAADQYAEARDSSATPDHVQSVLDEWYSRRALELKYLNSGGRAYQVYQDSLPADRARMLEQLSRDFYTQHWKNEHDKAPEFNTGSDFEEHLRQLGRQFELPGSKLGQESGPTAADRFAGPSQRLGVGAGDGGVSGMGIRAPAPGRSGIGIDPLDAAYRQFDVIANRPRSLAGPKHHLHDVPRGALDQLSPRSPMLVPGDALHKLESGVAVPAHRLRRSRDRDGELAAQRVTGRAADNAISQRARDARETAAASGQREEFSQIRLRLDATRLLAELSHSHGVRPNKYIVVSDREGGDRIRAGRRHLSVSDFLTKELNLRWGEASALLRAVYQRQLDDHPVPSVKELPRAALWRAFSVHRDAYLVERRAAWATQMESEQFRRAEIRTRFQEARATIKADTTRRSADRRAATSIALMQRVDEERVLRKAIVHERDVLKANFGPATGPSFGQWLRQQAEAGSESALAELRRTAPPEEVLPESAGDQNEIRPNRRQPQDEENAILYRGLALSWLIDARGTVTYRRDGVDVMRDRGAQVQLLVPGDDLIETALRLARAKYGPALMLSGSGAFQLSAARVVVERGLDITFSDLQLVRIMAEHRSQRVERLLDEARGPVAPAATLPASEEPRPTPGLQPGHGSPASGSGDEPAPGPGF